MTGLRTIRLLTVALAAAGVLLLGSQSGLADPNLPDIFPHRHFVETPNGDLVEVGPNVCDRPSLQGAFNQFHSNVHRPLGADAPGPAAPGLHNHRGAELVVVTEC